MSDDDKELDVSISDDYQGLDSLPNEVELVLLCLDYLRDLRRAYSPQLLERVEGINADYLTMACWSLNRAIVNPTHLCANEGNDPWIDSTSTTTTKPILSVIETNKEAIHQGFPDMASMEQEIFLLTNPAAVDDTNENETNVDVAEANSSIIIEYDDSHPSNSHRFYPLAGLASGPTLRGPLSLGEITAAGLTGLGARSRQEAEKDMIQSALFEQFVEAVKAKGFFDDPDNEGPFVRDGGGNLNEEKEREEKYEKVYHERYRKVVAKFRTKLATKADAITTGDLLAFSAADHHRRRREIRIQNALESSRYDGELVDGDDDDEPGTKLSRLQLKEKNTNVKGGGGGVDNPLSMSQYNPVDIEEAEKLKNQGNSYMQRKEYKLAAEFYTQALKLSPTGPNAHVYYSNRAAALVSMKKFQDAVLDSERSLTLKPDYGKAHARLGLAHFLLGNYRQAMEAYTVALKYEPDNKSSRNYLEKSAKRLAEMGEAPTKSAISYSVVSEWERGRHSKQSSSSKESSRGKTQHENEQSTTTQQQSMRTHDSNSNEREAEKYKVKGNSLMASRDYQQALDAYTNAIELCSNGTQSHVYFSNRAAALCYLERYEDAERDSLQSLELQPTYGKAHARLGLSRFFLHDYSGAVQAYTKALEYDPENAASKSYLAKAMGRMKGTTTTTNHNNNDGNDHSVFSLPSPRLV